MAMNQKGQVGKWAANLKQGAVWVALVADARYVLARQPHGETGPATTNKSLQIHISRPGGLLGKELNSTQQSLQKRMRGQVWSWLIAPEPGIPLLQDVFVLGRHSYDTAVLV